MCLRVYDDETFMLQIAAVYYYLCVVALQFVVPIIICLFFTFLYKTLGEKVFLFVIYSAIYILRLYIACAYFLFKLGGFTWEGILKGTLEEECPADELPKSLSSTINGDNIDKTVVQTAEELQLALGSLKQVICLNILKNIVEKDTICNII